MMSRRSPRPSFPALTLSTIAMAVVVIGACLTPGPTSSSRGSLSTSLQAQQILAHLRSQFTAQTPNTKTGIPSTAHSVLPASAANVSFGLAGDRLTSPSRDAASLSFGAASPDRAIAAFRGASIAISLVGAARVAPQLAPGYLVYPSAAPGGGHYLARVSANTFESYVVYPQANTTAAFRVEMLSGIAGLRKVGSTLEFLDASGTPHLHMAAPVVIDAAQHVRLAQLALPDCSVDTDPRPPWGRKVTPVNATACTVRISWDDKGLTYPLLLDPSWTFAADMLQGRSFHTLTALPNGRLVAIGGTDGTSSLSSAELYDPSTDSWSPIGPLLDARLGHTATLLPSGSVLVAGGLGFESPLSTAELIDPLTGTSAATGSLMSARLWASAARRDTNSVYICGGLDVYWTPLATCDAYTISGGNFQVAPSMAEPRYHFALTTLSDNTLLAIGGGGYFGPSATAERLSVSWGAVGSMAQARYRHSATLGASGKILVVGGIDTMGAALGSAEEYDPNTNTFTAAGSLSTARFAHTAIRSSLGDVVVAGGMTNSSSDPYTASTELFSWSNHSFSAGVPLGAARANHAVSSTSTEQIIVAGGDNAATLASPSVEIYHSPFECGLAGPAGAPPSIAPMLATPTDLTPATVDAFIDYAAQAIEQQAPDVRARIAAAASDSAVLAALVARLTAYPVSDPSRHMVISSILGQMRNIGAVNGLASVIWVAGRICGTATNENYDPTTGERLPAPDCDESVRARAVEMLAYVVTPTGDFSSVFNVSQNHTSKMVRLAAMDAYMWNNGDTTEAASTLLAHVNVAEQKFVRRPRRYRGMDAMAFEQQLMALYAANPADLPPEPVHVESGPLDLSCALNNPDAGRPDAN